MRTLYDHLLHTFVLCCLMAGCQARQYTIPPLRAICGGRIQAGQQAAQSTTPLSNEALIGTLAEAAQAETA